MDVFGRLSRRAQRRRKSFTRPQAKFSFETLESRVLLSGDPAPFTPLLVTQFDSQPSGFEIQFNQAIDPATLNLYETSSTNPTDLSIIGNNVGTVKGSLAVRGDTLTFVKTGTPLAPDTYTVSLRSALDALKGTTGGVIDGDGDGVAVDDYVATFTITAGTNVVVGTPDLVRGPGQNTALPSGEGGIPISINNGQGVHDLQVTFNYDPAFLTILSVSLASGIPAGATLISDSTTPGRLMLTMTSATALNAGPQTIFRIAAEVPPAAAYAATSAIHLTDLLVNNGAVSALADSAIQVVDYPGDVTGNRTYSSLDGQRVLRIAAGLDTVFTAFPSVDPLVLADITGNSQISSLDATRILQEVAGLDAAEIPPITPVILPVLGNDTGVSAKDALTFDPRLSGTVRDDGTITSLKLGVDGDLPANFKDITSELAGDTFSLDRAKLESVLGTGLADGTHTFQLQAIDNGGNASSIAHLTFTQDTAPPAIAAFGLSVGSDTDIAGDGITSAGVVSLTGASEPGSANAVGALKVLASSKGNFQIPNITLNSGTNAVTLTSTDAAGNSSQQTLNITRTDTVTVDVGLQWNQLTLDAIRLTVTDPPVAARALAMVSLAQYDTLAAIEGSAAYLVQQSVTGPVSVDIALAKAAHTVLTYLFPSLGAGFDSALNALLATVPDGIEKTNALALGLSVGNSILAIRSNDGSDTFVNYPGNETPGLWRPTAPMFDVAQDPQWADVTPFALSAPDEFRPPPPPALDTIEYAASVEEIRSLGSATSTTRTADQTQIAQFWADGAGSDTPVGHWNVIAREVALSRGNSLNANIHLLAELNVALADAAIAVWDSKYTYDLWRPIDAIRGAELDNNPATVEDNNWTPLLITPPHPEYVSGHSTFSSAAATVLTAVFGDNTAFSTTAFTLPGVTRSFSSFTAAAEEAGRSRIFGGIHYEFTNEAGQALGKLVGSAVLQRFILDQDLQAPAVVTAEVPATTKTNVTITGQVFDNISGVSAATWRVDNSPAQALALNLDGGFAVTTSFALDGTADGLHFLTIRAEDAAHNVASVLKSFILDTRSPVITLASIAPGGIIDVDVLAAGSANPTGSALTLLNYRFDDGLSRSISFIPETGQFEQFLTIGDLAPGAHTLILTAEDAAGNVETLTRTVTLAEAIPFVVESVSPVDGADEVGVTYRPQIVFSRPADISTLTSDSIYATGLGGQVINSIVVPSADGTFAWLFFQAPLPGSSTITIHINGDLILAARDHVALDANDDATDGGKLESSFVTVSTSVVLGTKLVGKVVDPGPDLEPMTFDDIRRGPDGIMHTPDDVFLAPIEHVKVYILGHEANFVYTDAAGNFELSGVPTGNVKVALDGRTATNAPAGVFFPEMVMDADFTPGITQTLMGTMGSVEERQYNADRQEVYLPRIPLTALQTVSNTAPTTITVDALSAPNLTSSQRSSLTLTVQPGSAVGQDGAVLTNLQLGISTVPPELVRDMLPAGVLQHTFDITIQAPGVATFVAPLQITFPNVFGAAPGTQLNILSFDHTTGRLVINGTATVSADGLTVVSDPGSGIRAPGWHGITPPGSNSDRPPRPPRRPEPPTSGDSSSTEDNGLPMIFGESGEFPLQTWAAPARVSGRNQPYLQVKIEIDGPLATFMNQSGNLELVDQTFRLDAGSTVTKSFGATAKSYAELFGITGITSQNYDLLYGSRVTITEEQVAADRTRVTTVRTFYLYRFIDATDANHDDGTIEFVDTVAGENISRIQTIRVIAGEESFPASISSTSGAPYSVDYGSLSAAVAFNPGSPGEDIEGALSVRSPDDRELPNRIRLKGDATAKQHIYVDTASIESTLTAIYAGTAPGVVNASISPAEKKFFDNLKDDGTPDPTERLNLANDIAARIYSLFAAFGTGISEGDPSDPNTITVSYKTIAGTQYLGGSDLAGGIDDKQAIIAAIASLNQNSIPVQYFNLDDAMNRTLTGTVEVYLDTPMENREIARQGFINSVAKTSSHEIGHTLGLVHHNGDIMKQGVDLTGSLQFQQGITVEAILMALNLDYTDDQANTALAYYIGSLSPGTHDAEEGVEEPGMEFVIPGPFLVLLDGATGSPENRNIDFGSVLVDGPGGSTFSSSLSLMNIGSSDVVLGSVKLVTGAGSFSIGSVPAGTVLASGKSIDFTVTFDPAAVGTQSARLQIESNDPRIPSTIQLTGTGSTNSPFASVDVGQNNLGGVEPGEIKTTSSALATITNLGGQPLMISGITIGEGSTSFSLAGVPKDLGSNPISLATGESFAFRVSFHPDREGLLRALIDIATNDPAHPTIRISAVGTGLGEIIYPEWGSDFVAVQTDTPGAVPLRDVSTAGGDFGFFLPDRVGYHIAIFDPVTGLISHGYGFAGTAANPTDFTDNLVFDASTTRDSDFDGLPDDIEFAIGTAPNAIDTDHDGLSDFAEIAQRLDPLSGLNVPTGIIASVSFQGSAMGVVVEGSTAYVATGAEGMAMVNVGEAGNPIVIGGIRLPGNSVDVAVDTKLQIAAVAAGTDGLHLVDVSDPLNIRLRTTVSLADPSNRVTVVAGVAYVASGKNLVAVDMLTGVVLQSLALGGNNLTDVVSEGFTLYTMDQSRQVRAISITPTQMIQRGGFTLNVGGGRLYVANGIAYIPAEVGTNGGFATLNVSDPDAFSFVSDRDNFAIAGRAIVLNGSGLAVSVGRPTNVDAIDLINAADPANTGVLLTRFTAPATPNDVAIGSGMAFVADGPAGLLVVNYRAVDTQGQPPVVTVTTDASDIDPDTSGVQIVEGTSIRLMPSITDDVQVREVQVLVNNQVVLTDVSFPWDLFVKAPATSFSGSTFTVLVRATDTGGNVALSAPLVFDLVPDATPPVVIETKPVDGDGIFLLRSVDIRFSEALDESALSMSGVHLVSTGADLQFGTSDDVKVDASLHLQVFGTLLRVVPDALAPSGNYRLTLDSEIIRDVAGNHLETPLTLNFSILEPLSTPALTGITAVASLGVPTNDGLASANSHQVIELVGTNFRLQDTQVQFAARDEFGAEFRIAVAPSSVSADGTHAQVEVPDNVETGLVHVTRVATEDMGFGTGADAIHRNIAVQFTSTGTSAEILFQDSGLEGLANESWGLDNVRLARATTPLTFILNEDFENGVGSAWSNVTRTQSLGFGTFSGRFSNQTQTLRVGGLIAGQTYRLTFDLYVFDTWDGTDGDDFLDVLINGTSRFHESFSVRQDDLQSFTSDAGVFLQIVPTITGFEQGRPGASGQYVIRGSGFMEGATTLVIGGMTLQDGYPDTPDFDIMGQAGGEGQLPTNNDRINIVTPLVLDGPIRVTTAGGYHEVPSATFDFVEGVDFTGIQPVRAIGGAPANLQMPSANTGQAITLLGQNFDNQTLVRFDAMDDSGTQGTITRTGFADNGGTTLTLEVPAMARTGSVRVVGDDGVFSLQVVPLIRSIGGIVAPGTSIVIEGSGFAGNGVVVTIDGIAATISGRRTIFDGLELPNYGNQTDQDQQVLDVIVPAGVGSGLVQVSTPGGYTTLKLGVEISLLTPFTPATDPGDSLATAANVELPINSKAQIAQTIGDGTFGDRDVDIYSFTANGGDRLTVEVSLLGGASLSHARVFDAAGNTIAADSTTGGGISPFIGGLVLPATGTYFVGVSAYSNQSYDPLTAGSGVSAETGDYQLFITRSNGTTIGGILSTASSGIPRQSGVASANVGQVITLIGTGFTASDEVFITEVSDEGFLTGRPNVPISVAADGTSMQLVVQHYATSGTVRLMRETSGIFLQIVPTVTNLTATPYEDILSGEGFAEGATAVNFGAQTLQDSGTTFGIDVRSYYFDFDNAESQAHYVRPAGVPPGPITVSTIGGTSAPLGLSVSGLAALAPSGSPADASKPSANAGQQITFQGSGFKADTTIVFSTIDDSGIMRLFFALPDTVNIDGTEITVAVPSTAITDYVKVLGDQTGTLFWLQIVPVVTSIDVDNVGHGLVLGKGFIEGHGTRYQFGNALLVDTTSGNGPNVSGNGTIVNLTLPQGGRGFFTVTTAGGTSAPVPWDIITPGIGPVLQDVAYNTAAGEMLVASSASPGLIYRIDPVTGAQLGSFAIPVANGTSLGLDIIPVGITLHDSASNTNVALPAGTLLVFNGTPDPNRIVAMNPITGAILATLNVAVNFHIRGGTVTSTGRIFILDPNPDMIREIDPLTGLEIVASRIDVNVDPHDGDVAIHPVTGNIWVASDDRTTLLEYTLSGTLVRTLNLGLYGIGNELGGLAFRTNSSGQVEMLATSKRGVVYILSGL